MQKLLWSVDCLWRSGVRKNLKANDGTANRSLSVGNRQFIFTSRGRHGRMCKNTEEDRIRSERSVSKTVDTVERRHPHPMNTHYSGASPR